LKTEQIRLLERELQVHSLVITSHIRAILHPLPNNELHPLQRNKCKDRVLMLPILTNTKTRKRRGGKENQQITRKSQIPSKIGAETKSQLEKKVNVLIVGNSNLRNVTEEKLTNDRRNLIVRFKPGMKIEEANKSADSKTEFDVIIVHAGTDKIRESTPKDLTDTIVNTLDKIQKSNPTARVAYSSIFKRNDDQILNIKSKKVNEPLEEKLSIVGMDIINNNKVLYRNLWSPSKRWMCA